MSGQLGKELAEFERQEALLRTITAQKEEIERLRAENERLRGALQWYAEDDFYHWEDRDCSAHIPILVDSGKRARQALQAPEREE